MADAVVGAAVEVLVQNLIALSLEEISLIRNFSKDLEKLKDSIITIQKFLEDAGTKEVADESVTRWLRKLEAVVFDADYVFDALSYQLLRKKVQRGGKMKKKVRCFSLNTKSLAFRHKMARKIKDIKGELKSIQEEATELGLQMKMATAPARGAGADVLAYLESDSSYVDPVFVGRENDVAEIVEAVTGDCSAEKVVSILPIVGMGGCGKTTLARKVFKDGKIISHFTKLVWVHVSENNFDPLTVLKSVAASSMGENIDGTREVVLQKLRNCFEQKRYLLVLDNLWNEDNEKWKSFVNSLKGISYGKGNVILVTSRSENVANIVKTLDIHGLTGLSGNHCWFIIKALAFGGGNVSSEFEIIGANIARRCQGLPLAAQVVGSLLRGKSKDEWVSIERNWLSSFGGDENTVTKILKLSFNNLSSPLQKKCFALCSIVPKGWWMEKDYLIDLWMAEGFLQTNGDDKDMEFTGNNIFNHLLHSSLLQVWQRDHYGNIKSCGMHDLVHDLASSVLNPDNNFKVHYISRTSMDESAPILKEDAKGLRALFGGKVSLIDLSNFKCLHTLILNDEDMNELPIEIGKLISLRCLDISHTQIKYLPDTIGDLYHLQTLRATEEYGGASYLQKLPHTLKFLISLRHLYIPNIELPPDAGKLVSLQTLPYFQVGDEEGCRITELGSLKNLKGELEIHNLERVGGKEDAKTAKLFEKANIFKVKFVWNECEEGEIRDENVLEGLQPHPNLMCLEIHGFRSTSFPLWILQMAVRDHLEGSCVRLENLIEVKLSGCKECEEIPMMGQLPNLKFLSLHGLTNVKSLGYSFYGIAGNTVHQEESVSVFPALERFELIDMENFMSWEEVGMFRCLEHLMLINCWKLTNAPSDFPCLKELKIDNMESCAPLGNICESKLTTLRELVISKVDGMVCLPEGLFHNNRDLLELEISSCNNLGSLVPYFRGGGSFLRRLLIEHCWKFNELPEDLHSLHALNKLEIMSCPNLKSIQYPRETQLSSQGFTSLCRLDFSLCRGMTNFPCEMLESCAKSLEWLRLSGLTSLSNFPQVMSILQKMPRLTYLGVDRVPKVTDVAEEIGSLCSLQALCIGGSPDCRDYVTFKSSLDRIFPALQSLDALVLYGMEEWDTIPEQLLHLTTLCSLMIVWFGIEELPEWIGELPSLTDLRLCGCPMLERLASKEAMSRLLQLRIVDCPLLEQNVKQQGSDSEWHKISHIPDVIVNWRPFL